jgi:transcriptional regulator EpsA
MTSEPGDELVDYTAMPIDTARALLRFMERAPDVCRRPQFYMLLQGQLQPLLPHTVAVCGAYDRQRKALVFDVFNTVPMPEPLLQGLRQADSPLLKQLADIWIQAQGGPVVTILEREPATPGDGALPALIAAGVQRLVVHGVSRPERLHEISSLFVFGGASPAVDADERRLMQLVVHGLHAAYLRVLEVERAVGATAQGSMREEARTSPAFRVTPREVQILSWVREGKTNHEIGIELGISALTVKNHIQKILRKMSASNRAHAVALAIESRLIDDARRC